MLGQTGNYELQAAGSKGSDNSNLYVYGDHLGSAVLALDANQKEAMRLGYSPFGQVYRKVSDNKFWKLNSGVNANNQLNQLMPYQYTGRYTEGATGYTNLDARWYNPYTQRFNQPDYWNFSNTGLPKAVQHELMQFTGLNTALLLRDPAQQMRYGYVRSNPLRYLDPFGLADYVCEIGSWNIPIVTDEITATLDGNSPMHIQYSAQAMYNEVHEKLENDEQVNFSTYNDTMSATNSGLLEQTRFEQEFSRTFSYYNPEVMSQGVVEGSDLVSGAMLAISPQAAAVDILVDTTIAKTQIDMARHDPGIPVAYKIYCED